MAIDEASLSRLAIVVEEASRASKRQDNPRFVEPGSGTLARAKARSHHIVFGRRGSGKTSLLSKAASDLTNLHPIAFVDLESFKGHSYPDVLLSVLIQTLNEFKKWLAEVPTTSESRNHFWNRLLGRTSTRRPFDKTKRKLLIERIDHQVQQLDTLLHSAEAIKVTETTEVTHQDQDETKGEVTVSVPSVSVGASMGSASSVSTREATIEELRKPKIDFLHRNIIDYQSLVREIAEASGGDAFLFLDDLYHIRGQDQALVVDYFHRIAKGNKLWLKIGTIRHRTEWYKHSKPPIGMKLGDDADQIDLDLTLEKYVGTKNFLMKVLQNIAKEANFTQLDELLIPSAIDRLVLASGGVARDFLGIFRGSLEFAQQRWKTDQRIFVQDVNQAAGDYYDRAKRDELKRDTPEERENVQGALRAITHFCLEVAEANCFVVEKDDDDEGARLIAELVDLRVLHLVKSRVTISNRPGKLYVAYMLDLGQYTGARTRRDLTMIEFWQRGSKGSEELRRSSLIYAPLEGATSSIPTEIHSEPELSQKDTSLDKKIDEYT